MVKQDYVVVTVFYILALRNIKHSNSHVCNAFDFIFTKKQSRCFATVHAMSLYVSGLRVNDFFDIKTMLLLIMYFTNT